MVEEETVMLNRGGVGAVVLCALLGVAAFASVWPTERIGRAFDMNPNDRIAEEEVSYEHEGVELTGFFAYPTNRAEPRPGVLVVHEWWGLNEYARERARRLARLGYAAFAVDMFGIDEPVDTAGEAQELVRPFYERRSLMRARARAGLSVLMGRDEVDRDDVAVMGYCFGGTVALELARDDAPVDLAVSFHGGLSTSDPGATASPPGASILVLHGAVDPFVPEAEQRGFFEEMEQAGADYTFIAYAGAVHSFTNPEADGYGLDGAAYDRVADERSWRHLLMALEESFADED